MTRAEFIARLKDLIEEAENSGRMEESTQNVSNDDSISRKAAIDALAQCPKHCIDVFHGYHIRIEDAEASIIKLPSAQPEQKKGRWLSYINGEQIKWENINGEMFPAESCFCSECGKWLIGSDEYDVYGNYCPNCGAKMEG